MIISEETKEAIKGLNKRINGTRQYAICKSYRTGELIIYTHEGEKNVQIEARPLNNYEALKWIDQKVFKLTSGALYGNLAQEKGASCITLDQEESYNEVKE